MRNFVNCYCERMRGNLINYVSYNISWDCHVVALAPSRNDSEIVILKGAIDIYCKVY